MSQDYLTESEFAARYHVARRTAQRWRTTGEGGPSWVQISARRVLYRLADCEAWAAVRICDGPTSRSTQQVT